MARLPYLDRADLPPEFQDLLERNINLHRLLVHSPIATRAWHIFARFIRHESRLDPRLRELAILQVGYITRTVGYEYSHHIKIGREFGVSDEDIRAIARKPPAGHQSQSAGEDRPASGSRDDPGAGDPGETFEDVRPISTTSG